MKETLGFGGVFMADDLDSMATMRGDSVAAVAIDALNAGCDFLLAADTGTQMDEIAEAINSMGNDLGREIGTSASKVRHLSCLSLRF